MSRAAHLAKYLDSGEKKKKSKDKSKHRRTEIVVENASMPTNGHEEVTTILTDGLNNEESAPTIVDEPIIQKEFRGFKRIDGKDSKITSENHSTPLETQPDTTVYRDKSGKIVDISARRKEIREEAAREEQEKRAQQEALKETELSKIKKSQLKSKLDQATTFTVSKNDVHMDSLLRSKSRFDDPLAIFSENSPIDTVNGKGTKISGGGKPQYSGERVQEPNRFAIKAGYFWDGIDRSNGFERLLLQKRNEKAWEKHNSKVASDDISREF